MDYSVSADVGTERSHTELAARVDSESFYFVWCVRLYLFLYTSN